MGTRFLPATKASPKEMMPIVDKPLIQYAVEEAVAAGITDMVFVTGRSKRAIEDHFDKAYELERELEVRGKSELLHFVRNMIPKNINCIYIRQPEALGLGHAVLCARPVIGDEPFAVLLADDLLDGETPIMKQMTDTYDYYRCSVLGVQDVPRADTRSYGIVDARPVADRLEQVCAIVEKPSPENAPSTLAVVGRYILTPRIFHHLETIKPGSGGEIQLTDGIASLLSEEQVLAYRYAGTRYDCGSKLGYLQATVAFGQRHPENKAVRLLDEAELVHSAEAVQAALDRLAGEIGVRLAGRHPLVLCVMTGGVVCCGQLLTRLAFPLDFDYLHATRYGPDTQGGKISWRTAPWTSVKDRLVLVVDDILDAGVTLAAVKESLKRLGATEVLVAVLADKATGRTKPVRADFVGLEVPDRFVFGFGMDVDGAWRNLSAIYAMKSDQ
ncbi:UNVERIFIED_CONTAM: hypothetical protein B566_EDAN011666 [Ephemera danica]|nr:hypothetical protein B566_EDAN011666 [Ephemera danica]